MSPVKRGRRAKIDEVAEVEDEFNIKAAPLNLNDVYDENNNCSPNATNFP